jgi:nitrous oxidase accessory protein
MYIEDSTENTLTRNEITSNFIGTQVFNISQNKVIDNSFISNVNEIQALKGTNNLIKNNYWDAGSKLDTNGDGKSNLPYQADPYFLNLISETPEFQLFFQDPGMLLLQKMLKSPDKKLVTDQSPLMKSKLHTESQAESNQTGIWVLSLIMMMGSLLLIVKGRK